MSVFISDFILQAELFSVHSLVSSISAPFGTPYTQGSFLAFTTGFLHQSSPENLRSLVVSEQLYRAELCFSIVFPMALFLFVCLHCALRNWKWSDCASRYGNFRLLVWVFVQKPFPGDWLLILASEKCKGELCIVHTENPATLRGLCNICFEVECF